MKSTRWYSNRQEKKVAKAVNGKQTANSGATAFQKGDVTTNDWLIECKTKTTEFVNYLVDLSLSDNKKIGDIGIRYMKEHKGITSQDAFKDLGITRLSARIKELRELGYNISTIMVDGTNRYGEPVRYGLYTLKGEPNGNN